MSKALVNLSGGQDSTTVLFFAKQNHPEVHCVTFDYGQRHSVEVDAAKTIAGLAGVASHEVIYIPNILVGSSPLVNKRESVEEYESAEVLPGGLEKTFVPGRNALFLVIAANRAYKLGCNDIYIGVSQEDYGGYPDCREEFIRRMESAIRSGFRFDNNDKFSPSLRTPLLYLNKKDTVVLARQLGGDCMEALSYSHTCYNGAVPPCGKCHACLLRERGFKDAGVTDPLISRIAAGIV